MFHCLFDSNMSTDRIKRFWVPEVLPVTAMVACRVCVHRSLSLTLCACPRVIVLSPSGCVRVLASSLSLPQAACMSSCHRSLSLMLCACPRVIALSPSGCVRVLETHVKLPLKLVAKACFPVKHNKFRVTIDTNKAAISLNTVFPGTPTARRYGVHLRRLRFTYLDYGMIYWNDLLVLDICIGWFENVCRQI